MSRTCALICSPIVPVHATQCSVTLVDQPFLINDVGLALHNDTPTALLMEIDRAIISIIQDGTMEE